MDALYCVKSRGLVKTNRTSDTSIIRFITQQMKPHTTYTMH